MKNIIYIQNKMPRVLTPLDPRDIRDAVSFTLLFEKIPMPCTVYVTLIDDEGIRALNSAHRGLDNATDVLSFPLYAFKPGNYGSLKNEIDLSTGRIPLGDIVISAERVFAQAVEYGNTVSRETTYLTVHSVLHLLGYDHIDPNDKKVMREREKYIMSRLGYDEKI